MKQMKKRLLALAALACLLAVTALAAGIPAAPQGSCVLDEANVLSAATEQKVNELTVALDEACGAQLAVLTVDFTGTLSMEEYAYQVFDAWGVGDKKKNNGVLLLLVTGDENYYCTVGTGLEKELTPSKIDDLLWDNLEDGFAAGDYDRGVTAFAGAVYDELCRIYNVQPAVGGGTPGYEPPRQAGFGMGSALFVIIVAAVLVLLIAVSSALHPVRYVRTRYFGYVYPPRPPRRWHRHYHRPPPPPPGPGFGPGYGPGPH
uniref:TPM domain-containing protein n=1 Tax=Allofournierella sp. TaxID=1940256 RepID=UPI003AB7AE74